MKSAKVFPTELETESHLTRRTIRGASFKSRPSVKHKWSSDTISDGNYFRMGDIHIANGNGSSTWQKKNASWGEAVVDVEVTELMRGDWITSHFEKKECIRYVPDTSKPKQPCSCGRTKDQHIPVAVYPGPPISADRSNTSSHPAKPWDPEADVQRMPTDAFGNVVFFPCIAKRIKPAKYVRVTEDTDPGLILNLLLQQWKLPRPKLVISVTGGAKNFKLNHQDQETFNRGLIRASQATGAWLLTGGTNIGVTKSVGMAVREGQSMKWVQRKASQGVNCIGIAPWGYIDNTEKLIGKNGQGLYPALYNINPVVVRGRPVALNPDHTHFILVDNGKKNKYGADMILRPKIEEAIAATGESGQGIPVVLVVLEGGTDSITNTRNATSRGIPTVVCEGTGRAADIIAYAHKHARVVDGVRQVAALTSLHTLQEKLHVAYDVDQDSMKMASLLEDVNACIQEEHLVTVFEMDRGENADMDLAILTALMKGQLATPTQQLSLALSWNRVDVAESKIFTDEVVWKDGSLDPFITSALVHNHVEFLRLFLEHGAIMKEYLTVARLRKLYNAANSDHHLRAMISKITKNPPESPIYLQDVGRLLNALTGAHNEPLYRTDKRVKQVGRGSLALMVLATSLSGTDLIQKSQEEFVASQGRDFTTGCKVLNIVELANPGLHFDQPFRELFLWAVLMNRMDMAEFFWERCENPVSTAIAASRIMYRIAKQTADLDRKSKYKENARLFENLATNVIDECYQIDEEFAGMLIDCPHPHWQGKNSLTMAASAKNQVFISHPCCQNVLSRIWNGGLVSCPWWRIILSIFLPVCILWLDFKLIRHRDGQVQQPRWYNKPGIFYKSPKTKFWTYLLSYIAFLLLYSYVLLFNFEYQVSVLDYVLFGWIATMVLEEFREVVPNLTKKETFSEKFGAWIKSEFNIMDFVMLTVAVVGFSLHMSESTHWWARTLYSVNACIFFVRFMRTFSVSESLGPKMVMIKKMIIEMLLFLCILVVFMVGYGVASQALLYPNQEVSLQAFKNILYMPYFQIYGELFLEVVVEGKCDPNESVCPVKNPVVAILLGIYLLLGNVLLLNLLIAIFSYVFDEVQTNALKVWKYELFFLVSEIKDRPTLPPPLVVVEHFFLILHWSYKTIMLYTTDSSSCHTRSEHDLRHLHLFEKECAANYRRKKADAENAEVPERMNRIEKRLDDLIKHAECQKVTVDEPELLNKSRRTTMTSDLAPYDKPTTIGDAADMPSSQWWEKDIRNMSPTRLPPIHESTLPDEPNDGSGDNIVIEYRSLSQTDPSKSEVVRRPPDGGCVVTEKHRSSSSSRRKSRKSRSERSSVHRKTSSHSRSKNKSSRCSDKDSVVTSASKASHRSKYSNDPMSDFKLKRFFESSNEQMTTGQPSSSKSNAKMSHSTSSSSTSEDSPRKPYDASNKRREAGNENDLIALQQRMNQLEDSSTETQNSLQRIEQLLKLVIESKEK